MSIEQVYEAIGGNFKEISTRLPSVGLIEKFAVRFLDDDSYSVLCDAMKKRSAEEAFRAAHTLKGVSANMAFTRILTSVSELTETLRGETSITEKADELFETVKADYELTAKAISDFAGK